MRLWERALRRASIDIAYSEGFTPHPRLSLAAPLAGGRHQLRRAPRRLPQQPPLPPRAHPPRLRASCRRASSSLRCRRSACVPPRAIGGALGRVPVDAARTVASGRGRAGGDRRLPGGGEPPLGAPARQEIPASTTSAPSSTTCGWSGMRTARPSACVCAPTAAAAAAPSR